MFPRRSPLWRRSARGGSRLTWTSIVGIFANMASRLIYRHRVDFDDGEIIEIVVWLLTQPVPGCAHSFKYRLFYGNPGRRIVGYDNERPKGDHRHADGTEAPYQFTSPERLIEDFLADVAERRKP